MIKKKPKAKVKKKMGRPRKTNSTEIMKALIPFPIEAIEGEVMEEGPNDRFGRPTVITPKVKELLLQAFAWGCSNKEAATYAGIAEKTLDNLNKREPDFKEFCNDIKETPIFQARQTVVNAIKHDPFLALRYLERKRSAEFSVRAQLTFEPPEPLTPQEIEDINNVIDENF